VSEHDEQVRSNGEVEEFSQSLQERMRKRRDEIEGLVSEKFPLPRYESVCAVELRYLGYEGQRAMFERNKRQRNTAIKELYTACDSILAATVGFYELRDGDDDEGIPKDYSWNSLAELVLGDDLRDDATPRQAMIALLGAESVPILWNDWQEWMGGQRMDLDRELGRDFQATK